MQHLIDEVNRAGGPSIHDLKAALLFEHECARAELRLYWRPLDTD
jgi:hypothetical protein